MDYNLIKTNPLLKQHVIYCGRYDLLRNVDFAKTRAVISINDTIDEMKEVVHALRDTTNHVHPFCFLDVGDGEDGAISLRQAEALVQCIEDYRDSNFLVHCFAGASRSAAVAKFIVEYLQLDDSDTTNLKYYNEYVYNMLKSTLLE